MRFMSLLLITACAGSSASTPKAPAPAPAPGPAPAPAPAPAAAPAASTGVAAPDTLPIAGGNLVIQPIYHATVVLEEGGKTWITDPWTKGPIAGRKADVVLLTDIHPDHLDPAGIDSVRKEGTVVVGPKAVADKVKVDIVLANGESKDVAGVHVTAVPMYNLTRGPEAGKLYHDKGRGNGYLLDIGQGADAKRIYIAGDTECTPEVKALEHVDVAFLPMNLPYTMPPDEAAACALAFHPKILYPYHYGTSDLSILDTALAGSGTEVRKRDWYPGGQPF
jgi:L-ascorbate metabolism protein UlaG (beta-lactamase superfamily)